MSTMRGLDESITRTLPSNLEAEQGVIGACLLNNDAFRKVSNIVEAEHFHEAAHRQVWAVLAAIITKGQVATPVTMMPYLGEADFGGIRVSEYLARLAATATTVVNAPDYARSVRDTALRRQLIELGQEIISTAFDIPLEATAETLFADLEKGLEDRRPGFTGEVSDFQDLSRISMAEVYDAYREERGLTGISTGFPAINEIVGGLKAEHLVILAGRPAMGKTALATNMAVQVAQWVRAEHKQGDRKGWVGFFSLEMSAEQLKQRIVCDLAGVPFWKINRGKQSRTEMERFEEWDREIGRLPLAIDKTGGQSIAQIAMKARSLKRRRGLSLLVVDYLQLVKGSRRFNSRSDEVTEISTGLKALAKELGCPIIALSQLNRQLESRDDKRPKLVDLKESGSIEQDADVVIFIHREEYYIKNAEPRDPASEMHARWRADMRRWSGVAEVIVAKNRHGSTGTAEIGFEAEFTRFTNEPAPREVDPREVRERSEKKRVSLPKEATILKGILRSLAIGKGHVATSDQRRVDHRLPAGARIVLREDAWRAYGAELMPTEPEDKQKAAFQAAFKHLRHADLAFYPTPTEAGVFCALPEVWD